MTTTTVPGEALTIAGGPLQPILEQFNEELQRVGVRITPHFYLADEWGVLFDAERPWPSSRSIAIPFYLARTELAALHASRGHDVAGTQPDDILRFLRHELGHVVNYAYRLYTEKDWAGHFGDFKDSYEADYRYDPLSRDFVQNLPSSYAQKHPDEDWAETFAVWMMPHHDWRSRYAAWPKALAKLTYCDRVMADLARRNPPETTTVADGDGYDRVPEDWHPEE